MLNYTNFNQQNMSWNKKDFSYTNELFSNRSSQTFYKIIEENLPAVFTRRTASLAIGGLISPKTFSNLDSLGQGPPIKVKLGKKIGYERDSFIQWLRTRITI